MTEFEIKELLNNGIGSPGETARALSSEYRKLRAKLDKKEACQKILYLKALSYSMNGFDVFNDLLIERILTKANGNLPFIIFADVFTSNNQQSQDNAQAVIDNLDIILSLIIDNYNSIVDTNDKYSNLNNLKNMAQEFIYEELN